MKKTIMGKPGQTIIDLAIQLTGSFEGIKTFFENNDNVLDLSSIDGLEIKYNETIIDQSIIDYFDNRTIVTR